MSGGGVRRAGDRVLDGKKLSEVGADGAAKGLVIRGARGGQFVLAHGERCVRR